MTRRCQRWGEHCHAFHDGAKWAALRAANLKSKNAAAAAPPAAAAAASSSAAAAAKQWAAAVPAISVDELLRRVQQVFPVEAPKPAGMVVENLRPYQKQCIAFMQRNETLPKGSEHV